MSGPLILAIDTSFGPVGVTLSTWDMRTQGRIEDDNPAGTQAETLPPLVEKLFEGYDFKQLTRIAVTVGPGAFTGVRVGLAFAKGIKLATGAEILGFTTLECMAAQASHNKGCSTVGAVIDAKRGEVYVQAFSHILEPLSGPALLPVAEASAMLRRTLKPKKMLLTGSGASLLDGFEGVEIVEIERIDTELLARRGILADPARYPAVPAYLREPDARLPMRIRRASVADAATLAALHAPVFSDAWPEASFSSLLEREGVVTLLGARGESAPAGFILVRAAAGEAEVLTFCVADAARRSGLGRALLQRACAEAARLGAREMFLEVAEANVPARSLYGAEGFAVVGRRAAYYHQEAGSADALVMRKAL